MPNEVSFESMLGIEDEVPVENMVENESDVSFDSMIGESSYPGAPGSRKVGYPKPKTPSWASVDEINPKGLDLNQPIFKDTILGMIYSEFKKPGSVPIFNEDKISELPYEGPQLSTVKDQGIIDKFKSWWLTPDISPDKAANIIGLSNQYGISPTKALRHYDDLSAEAMGGMTDRMYWKKMSELGMNLAIGGGVIKYGAMPVIKGLAAFMGVDEAINIVASATSKDIDYEFQGGKGISDMLQAEGLARDTLDIAEFVGEGITAGAAVKVANPITSNLIKGIRNRIDKITTINKVASKVKETKKSPDKVIIENGEELGIDLDAVKRAHDKIIDMKGIQSELERVNKESLIDYGKWIKEDLEIKGRQVSEVKQAQVKAFITNSEKQQLKSKGYSDEQISKMKPDEASEILRPSINSKQIKQAKKFIVDEVVNEANEKLPEAKKVVEKPKPTDLEAAEIDMTIKDIEKEYGRPIEEISDAEVESYYEKVYKETDNDLAIEVAEREPVMLDTEHSPFRETPESTKARAELFSKTKGVMEDPELFTSKLINDVNRWLDGEEVPIKEVRNGLSEFATRAEEIRDYFRESEDYPSNFENWKEMVSEAASWARKAKRKAKRKSEGGVKLFDIGGATVEGAKQIIDAAKRAKNYIAQSRGMKSFKPIQAAKMLKEELVRTWVDRSGNIRKSLLKKEGNVGYEILQKMYLSKGASARAAMNLKQMQKEVYRGLNKNEKRILDSLIFHNRMVDLAKYKTPKQFKYFKEHPIDESIAYIELLGQLEKLSPEQVADMHNRAAGYFEWMKKPLKDMYESGLISQQEYTDLAAHNYRKLKLVDIFDNRYETKIGDKKRTVYDSGVESLARGKDTDIFESSSEIMALEVFNRAYGRIMNNEANKNLLSLAKSDKENPFVRYKESPNDSVPSGWDRVFVFENGERKALYLSPELSKEWIINNPELSFKMSQLLRYASGSQVLRTFATGINWGFALANMPRDIMHTWFAARAWENGKWKPIYSPHVPVFGLQIARDLGSVFTDALLRKGRYEDYLNEGGGMEFMVHQGRLLQRGRHLEGTLDKIENFLGYFGETSEILTRLAIRERALRKGKKAQEATFIARDYMDFGQGGSIAKAVDNALPYLNASIQGSRGIFRAFKDNLLRSTYKLAQFGALVTGIYIAMDKRSPETKKNLQGDPTMTSNLVIPLGDEFGFIDKNGQTRYPYIKIPLDPGQRFFKKFFEASTDKWLGNEIDVSGTVKALGELSPVDVGSLPPTLSGVLGYMTNKDFWLNEDIWKDSDTFSYPNSKQEFNARTPELAVDIGNLTGLSPERLKYAVGELVPSNTVWAYLAGKGYDEVFGNMPKENKEQHLAMVLSQVPGINRFIGVTNPYSKYSEKIDKVQEAQVIKEFIENRNFDIKVNAFLRGEGVTRQDLVKEAGQYKDRDTYDRLMDRLKFEEGIKNLPEKSFWRRMKGLRMEAKAQVFVDRLNNSTPEEAAQLWKEYAIVARAKGIISPELRKEIGRLRAKQ